MPNAIKGAPAPQASICNEIQNLFDVAYEQMQAAKAILNAAEVLCALERAPAHHDTHPDHIIMTGGGFAHGRKVIDETLPTILSHAGSLVEMAANDFDVVREVAINALKGGAL